MIPSPDPLPLWTFRGVATTLHASTIACDFCGYPIGHEGQPLVVLIQATYKHAQRHAAEATQPTSTLDHPRGWFDVNGDLGYTVVCPDGYVGFHVDPTAAVLVASSIAGKVIGPLPIFADFGTPTAAALAAPADEVVNFGPVTTEELQPFPDARFGGGTPTPPQRVAVSLLAKAWNLAPEEIRRAGARLTAMTGRPDAWDGDTQTVSITALPALRVLLYSMSADAGTDAGAIVAAMDQDGVLTMLPTRNRYGQESA